MQYDYIIIGAGSAGCVLANRLSKNPNNSVLVLEAGGKDTKLEIKIPLATNALYHTEIDWDHTPEPMPNANNRQIFYPRGKVLGGSSSINTMMYVRGHRKDYDAWADLGNKGWSYDEVLPYFKKSENHYGGESEYHGAGGALCVERSDSRYHNVLWDALIEAGQSVGLEKNEDFNGEKQEGIGLYDNNTHKGERCSTARAFLKPAMKRKNLKVITYAHVQRIKMNGNKAVGIIYKHKGKGKNIEVLAKQEIILSAGAINTPQIMMLSGLGDATELKKHGIKIVADLKGVGKNLKDHPFLPLCWLTKGNVSVNSQLAGFKIVGAALKWLFSKKGPLAVQTATCGGFVTLGDDAQHPDLQLIFTAGWSDKLDAPFEQRKKEGGFLILPTLLRPKSTGYIGLKSSDPNDDPAIHLNFFEKEEDLNLLVKGVRLVQKIINAPAFDAYREKPIVPDYPIETDEAIKAYARKAIETTYHPIGTCKMGHDDLAVVDDTLKVHGIEGLRIVDASIMPTIPSGNTNAPVIMVAEKAADLILRG